MLKPSTHILAEPGDKKALCGQRKPQSTVWVEAAPNHRYPHPRCHVCYDLAGLAWMIEAPTLFNEETA